MVDGLCVPPKRVADMWGEAAPLIRSALVNTLTDFAVVEADVLAGRALLWVVKYGRSEIITAAAVTALSVSNGRKFCTIVACGGRDLAQWKHVIRRIERFAQNEGCVSIVIMGRRGWAREYPDYEMIGVILEKDLT